MNYTRNPLRRFSFDVGVDVDEDLTQVQRIGLETLYAMNGVLDDPKPFMRIQQLGDFNVVVTYFGWIDQTAADFGKVRSEAIRLVKTALDAADVLMPEPIYNVRMQSAQAPGPSTLERKESKTGQRQASVAEQAARADVSVDQEIEEQIQDDLATSDEPNLLTK
jgi:small-conductance mechanosensitive channel